MGRSRALAAIPVRRLLPLLAFLVLLAAPATVAADGSACTITGTSTSGGSVDLLSTPVWHLRSTDHVTVSAYAPTPQADVTVSAYALGFGIPIANGTTSGGVTVADADYDVATLAAVGRVFVVSGSSAGPFGACTGNVVIVLDDVSPFATGLGIGSVAVSLIGLLGIGWGVRNPGSRVRRVFSLASALFMLAGGSVLLQQISTPGDAPASLGPSALAAAVPGPTQVVTDPLTLAQAAGLVLLVVLVMPFPAELFNKTLEANLHRVRAAMRRVPLVGWLVREDARPPAGSAAHTLAIAAFVLGAGLLYALLDPSFGPNARSAVTFAGIVAALAAVTWLRGLPMRAAHRAATPDGSDRGRLEAVLGTLGVAAACVLISRLTGFQPGYLYGLVIGYAFVRELDATQQGRVLSAGAWWMLGLSLVSWLMLSAVRGPGVGDTAPGQILESVLAAITVAGIEGIAFGLVPLRFLPGEPIFRWSRMSWSLPYAIGLFAFVWIILNPKNGFAKATDQAGFVTAAALFIGFGLVSVLFWAYFRFRPTAPAVPA
jgi:hypothetical protein